MNILLATDGSDTARLAVDFLTNFPFPKDSTATVLTVIDKNIFSHEEPEVFSEAQSEAFRGAENVMKNESSRLVATESERLVNAGWTVSPVIRVGDPVVEIIKAAAELGVDLVVLGSHGLAGIEKFLLGSVCERVLEYAHCSVLIVKHTAGLDKTPGTTPGGDPHPPWRILVAYDDSKPSREALSMCAALPLDARAEVTAVTVLPMVTAYRQDIQLQLNAIWKQKKHAARSALEGAVEDLHWSTPNVDTVLREASDAAVEILHMVEKSATDLVIVGNKGKSAIRRFLIGSGTRRIARHAHCSVWAVRK